MHGLETIKRLNDEQVERERLFARMRKAGRLRPVKPVKSRSRALYDELVEDVVAIARGKSLKPTADRYPYDGNWRDA